MPDPVSEAQRSGCGSVKPVRVERESSSALSVRWDDGHRGRHTMQSLRAHCPCAACRSDIETRGGPAVLPILIPGQYELKSIEPVGNYALQLSWGDGHRTGIYTFEHLRQICECEECRKTNAE